MGHARYVDRTIQNVHVPHLLFLCPGKHYERALRQLATMEVGARNLHLLPAECFLRNPAFYLDAIRTPDRALDWHILLQPPKRCLPVPVDYSGFRALIEDQVGVYKLLDWWNGVDIGKVQTWVEDYAACVYLIPDDPGKRVSGWVYVADDTMRVGFAKLLGNIIGEPTQAQ